MSDQSAIIKEMVRASAEECEPGLLDFWDCYDEMIVSKSPASESFKTSGDSNLADLGIASGLAFAFLYEVGKKILEKARNKAVDLTAEGIMRVVQSPETKRKFRLELEIEIPPGVSEEQVHQAIAAQLQSASKQVNQSTTIRE